MEDIEFKSYSGYTSEVEEKKDKFISKIYKTSTSKKTLIETKEFSSRREADNFIDKTIKKYFHEENY